MKNINIIRFVCLLILSLFIFSGCAKDPDEPEEETPTTPITPPPAKFSWVINGGTTVVADETYFVEAYSDIYAAKGTKTIDIILDALDKGTYQISQPIRTLDYFDGTNTQKGQSGTVVITEKSAGLISGSFTCTMSSGGSSSTISGEFSNIPKK